MVQHTCLKGYSFSTKSTLHLWSKSGVHMCVGLFLDSILLIYLYIFSSIPCCLGIVKKPLKSISVSILILFFFKTVLAFLGFCIFKEISIFRRPAKILILYVCWTYKSIWEELTPILSFLIYAHGISLHIFRDMFYLSAMFYSFHCTSLSHLLLDSTLGTVSSC